MSINANNFKITYKIRKIVDNRYVNIVAHNNSPVDINIIEVFYQIINKKGVTERKATETTRDISAGEKREILDCRVFQSLGQRELKVTKISLKASDGSLFELPSPPNFKISPCFVTTVTYGNCNHPTVEIFRSFRDEVLVEYSFGRKFIEWYEMYGSSLAIKLENRRFLKVLLRMILTPLAKAINLFRR
jgi:hypothetical protein